MGGIVAVTLHHSKSMTAFRASGVTELDSPVLSQNHFCLEYMYETGCKWTEEYKCPHEDSYMGKAVGAHGEANDDQSLGFHCCCSLKFFSLTYEQIEGSIKDGIGLSPEERTMWSQKVEIKMDEVKAKKDAEEKAGKKRASEEKASKRKVEEQEEAERVRE